MKEFGSDYHALPLQPGGPRFETLIPNCIYYASGRQALEALVAFKGYRRIFVPSYFCQESLARLRQMVDVEEYDFIPGDDFCVVLRDLPLEKGDAILTVNYFGLDNLDCRFPDDVDVIEDHTHSPAGYGAVTSRADWCVASLRKVFPIPDGGALWSPKGYQLPSQPPLAEEVEQAMITRLSAMEMKSKYLSIPASQEAGALKEEFRRRFISTEEKFDEFPISDMSPQSYAILRGIDVEKWIGARIRNWRILRKALPYGRDFRVMEPRYLVSDPFSFVVIFDSPERREVVRQSLIKADVYPAVLWPIDREPDDRATRFSHRMLSIHCDGRYSADEMKQLAGLLRKLLY